MRKRPCLWVAAGLSAGILAAGHGVGGLLGTAAGVLALEIARWFFRRKERPLLTGIFLLFVFLGWGRCLLQQEFRERYLPYITDGQQISVQGRIDQKEYKNDQYLYYLSSCRVGQVSCNQIIVYFDSDSYAIGEILVLDGTAVLWETAVNEGNFDRKAYYEAKKIDFAVKNPRVRGVYGKENRIKERLFLLRERLREVYAAAMTERDAGILATMVLGDKSLLDAEVKTLYQVSGISHILAISGLHISVIGMSLYRLLRRARLGFWGAGILSGIFMGCYGSMTGMGTSVFRAVCMFFLMLFAQAVGRSYDSLNALGAAALLLLWDNPGILSDAGFRLSFLAVIGVVWMGGTVRDWFAGHAVLRKLAADAVVQLATLPIVSWYFFEIPIYAVWVNLAVLPFVSVVLAAGILGGIVGLWRTGAAQILLFPAHVVLSGYERLCSLAAALPHASWITGKPSAGRLVIYYLFLAAGICFLKYRTKMRKEGKEDMRQAGGRQTVVPLLAGLLLLLILFVRPRGGFELDVLDVGQGDGIFLRTQSGHVLMIDGGSSDVGKVGQYRLLPFLKSRGIGAVDYWFVSHTDSDHISGLLEVFSSRYRVRHLILAQGIAQDEAYRTLIGLARENGTEVCFMAAGDVLHLGDAEMTALYGANNMTGNLSDKNENSLVLWYEEDGFTAIFPGDIGSEREAEITDFLETGDVDFYKAAHHGSKYSNSEAFLKLLSPKITAISCAEKNSYGHPAREAVERIKQTGSAVFYTMEAWQIKVTRKGTDIYVEKFKERGSVFLFPGKNH